MDLNRKLQGKESQLGQGASDPGAAASGLTAHVWVPPLQRPCRSPQTVGSWSSCRRKCRLYRTGCQVSPPTLPHIFPLPSPWRPASLPSTPESSLGSSPAPAVHMLCELRELS